ncbi:uncharacterized protein B0H64DRAFT_406350 [Chaetomium fimeti]|uniref:Uncharacterized protein n=1 Tax=Chaetomium fimeti TaxID=1854472 RepID=A0AAE0LP87_9PEZI|nr:hypothetical protein B0H64DRAFT_406350 [Chaetomium fimeti]
MAYTTRFTTIAGMPSVIFTSANATAEDLEDMDFEVIQIDIPAPTTGDAASTTNDAVPTTGNAARINMQDIFTALRIDDAAPTTGDAASTTGDAAPTTDDAAWITDDDASSTTDDSSSTTDDSSSTTDEEIFIAKDLVFDEKGRLVIDALCVADKDAPHHRWMYRHRVSLDAMERASPVWKEKIFGPEGEERPKPTDDEEDWTLVLDDDDQPPAIAMQLALINGKPEVVPLWHNNPDTMRVCTNIFEFIGTADKYGVLPLFRPFVSHWLPHARPSSGNADVNYVHRMEAAWQLGALGLVQDHVRKLVYDWVFTPAILDASLARLSLANDDGLLTSVPQLLDVVGKRQLELIQSVLDFFHHFLADLRGEKGICQHSLPGTPDYDLCNAGVDEFVSKRMEEPAIGKIPVEAKDYPLTIYHLLHTVTHVLGVSCTPGPKQLEGHACVPALHKKCVDLATELLGRWKGAESILEPEQVEWLKERGEILGTESSSACETV